MGFQERKKQAEAQWGRHICCSESIMLCILQDMEYDEGRARDLVRAMGAFCGGMGAGLLCGALAGGVAAAYVACEDYAQAHDELRPEIIDWFKDRFGATECSDILEGDEMRKFTLCPGIMEEVYEKVHGILEEVGVL
ncbi:MAG: C-GCAxxG-C-C family protein [Clostridiales bacterium]|nr:C-GCAxxG-C-C family protein [Clostridiales bacterium]